MKKILAVASLIALMSAPAAQAATLGEVNVPVLNVRAEASITGELLGQVTEGMNFEVAEQTTNNWCKIMFKTKAAFVACQYLTLTSFVEAPAASSTTTPAPVVETTEKPVVTEAPTTTATGFPLVRVVTVPALNVRSSASVAEDNLLGKLAQNERVSVLEKNAQNWCKITFTGKTAWISCMYLAKAEDAPKVTTPAAPAVTEDKETTETPVNNNPTISTGATLPSTPEGCVWSEQTFSVLSMKVQQCVADGFTFGVKGNAIYKYKGDLDTIALNPVLEVYAKGADEPVMDAVMSLVAGTIPADEQGKCLVQKAPYSLLDAKKELYVLAPTSAYQKVIDDRRANEKNVVACGEYGQHDIAQYFEYHPEQSKTLFAFVRSGEHGKDFDQNSIVIK